MIAVQGFFSFLFSLDSSFPRLRSAKLLMRASQAKETTAPF